MSAAEGVSVKKSCCKKNSSTSEKKLVSDLPLYGNPYPPKDVILNRDDAGLLEQQIRLVRHAIFGNLGFLETGIERSQQIVSTGIAHSRSTIEMITDEGNTVPKAVAITTGGLLGLLFASRKGFFRKIFYTGLGLGAVTGICYPKQTYELLEVSGYIAKNKGIPLIKEYTNIDLSSILPGNNKDVNASKSLNSIEIPKDRDQSNEKDNELISNRSSK